MSKSIHEKYLLDQENRKVLSMKKSSMALEIGGRLSEKAVVILQVFSLFTYFVLVTVCEKVHEILWMGHRGFCIRVKGI